MHFSCPKAFAYISYFVFVNAIVIFNMNKFIIDTPFENIKSAVTSGYMQCGLTNERLELHHNKFNGTHIIFSYRQTCDIRSMLDYAKKDQIYFNEFMRCNLNYIISSCIGRPDFFAFDDTCSIEYNRACEERILGPCITSPDDSKTSSTSVILQLGNDTVEFTTEEIQRALGKVITCDPNMVQKIIQRSNGLSEHGYQIFRYGRQMCAINKKVQGVCPPNICCYPAFLNVQDKYGQKLNKTPFAESEMFTK